MLFPASDLAAAVWIDLVSPTAEEIDKVQKATGLKVPTENEVSEIESSSRLAFDGGVYRLSAPLIVHNDDVLEPTPVGFVLSEKVLVTVRFARLLVFEEAQNKAPQNSADAFLRLFEAIVDRAADALEHAGQECDDLSQRAFRRAKNETKKEASLKNALQRLGAVADHVSRIRDTLLGIGRIIDYVSGAVWIDPARARSIHSDVVSLTDYEAHLAGKIQFLLDATMGFINIEQNEIVKALTIASVVGIPPVLVAGVYGMNFKFMPELNWPFGYPLALVLMLVTGLLPMLWFKKRGWF